MAGRGGAGDMAENCKACAAATSAGVSDAASAVYVASQQMWAARSLASGARAVSSGARAFGKCEMLGGRSVWLKPCSMS